MKEKYEKIENITILTHEEFENLPPKIRKWLSMTSNKVIAKCQQGEMMGFESFRYVGDETFRT